MENVKFYRVLLNDGYRVDKVEKKKEKKAL